MKRWVSLKLRKMNPIGKAEADRDSRIKISEANASAIKGENEAKIEIANSDALRTRKRSRILAYRYLSRESTAG